MHVVLVGCRSDLRQCLRDANWHVPWSMLDIMQTAHKKTCLRPVCGLLNLLDNTWRHEVCCICIRLFGAYAWCQQSHNVGDAGKCSNQTQCCSTTYPLPQLYVCDIQAGE
jgi:hypothetical protein